MAINIGLDMDKWTGFAPEDCVKSTIRPIPCTGARVIVEIDGRPYAGFANRAAAEEAVRLWSGEMTGGGLPISARYAASAGWRAVRGHLLTIVER